jgi:hypothetical protein
MTPAQLIEELKKLPANATIRYLDIDDSDYDEIRGLDWKELDRSSAVGIDFTPDTDSPALPDRADPSARSGDTRL